jgi:ribonuclease Z
MKVQILGNNSGGLFIKRHFSAQVVQLEGRRYLIDCGEGTQMQIVKYKVKFERIHHIFISHLHGDHVLGLVGLISSFTMRLRKAPLDVYGPDGLKRFLEVQFELCSVRLSFEVRVHIVSCTQSALLVDDDMIEISTIPLKHRVPAVGYLFRSKPAKLLNLRPDVVPAYGLSIEQIKAAKAGQDVFDANGTLIAPDLLTLPIKPTVAYAYCSDTAYSEKVVESVRGVDLLYHEATFLEKARARATETGHSTAVDAANVAQKAGVKRLILGHLSGRYDDWELHLAEARPIFAETYGTEEGENYEL